MREEEITNLLDKGQGAMKEEEDIKDMKTGIIKKENTIRKGIIEKEANKIIDPFNIKLIII